MADLENRDTKREIIKAVENFFKIDKVKHEPFNERGVANASYAVESKFGHVKVFFHAYKNKLVLHTIIPLNASEEERAKVGEFLLRANYGLNSGGFDFDFDDGKISYRTSIYCGDDGFVPPTYEQIYFALAVSLMMIDKYGDALVKVMFGLVEPEDAIESAEDDED